MCASPDSSASRSARREPAGPRRLVRLEAARRAEARRAPAQLRWQSRVSSRIEHDGLYAAVRRADQALLAQHADHLRPRGRRAPCGQGLRPPSPSASRGEPHCRVVRLVAPVSGRGAGAQVEVGHPDAAPIPEHLQVEETHGAFDGQGIRYHGRPERRRPRRGGSGRPRRTRRTRGAAPVRRAGSTGRCSRARNRRRAPRSRRAAPAARSRSCRQGARSRGADHPLFASTPAAIRLEQERKPALRLPRLEQARRRDLVLRAELAQAALGAEARDQLRRRNAGDRSDRLGAPGPARPAAASSSSVAGKTTWMRRRRQNLEEGSRKGVSFPQRRYHLVVVRRDAW